VLNALSNSGKKRAILYSLNYPFSQIEILPNDERTHNLPPYTIADFLR
jgi:hypothetical protein